MGITLYHFNNSVCSQKVRLVLVEKGLEWDEQVVDLFTLEQYEPEYIKLNPKGVVPTVVHDGRAVIESTLICEYLDDVFPDPPLKPTDPAECAAMRVWTKAVDEGIHEGVTAISFSAMFRERMKGMSDEQRARRYRNIGDPARRDRDRAVFEHGVDSPHVFNAIAAYEALFGKLEKVLADGRAWLMGDIYSLAEIGIAPYAARLEYLELLTVWVEHRPAVAAWWERIKARPGYRMGLSDLLTEAEIEPMNRFGGAIRQRMAERRQEYFEDFLAAG